MTAGRRTAAASTAASGAECRIGFRIDEQAIEEQIDRLRHDFDGVERAAVERMVGALDAVNAVGTPAALSLLKKSMLDASGTVMSAVPCTKIVGAKLEPM